jgi:hypothetical protein
MAHICFDYGFGVSIPAVHAQGFAGLFMQLQRLPHRWNHLDPGD